MDNHDPSDRGREWPAGVSSEESHAAEAKKTCADCGTTKTPLWRGGPAGPKSLCNACGIRSRKKRRAILGLTKGGAAEDNKKGKRSGSSATNNSGSSSSSSSSSNNSDRGDRLGEESWKRRILAIRNHVAMRQRSSAVERQRKKLGEEEQAAMLLMALSCGSVYA